MKRFLVIAVLIVTAYFGLEQDLVPTRSSEAQTAQQAGSPDAVLAAAYEQKKSNLQVVGTGIVLKLLPDDNKGSRHQRFLLRLGSGQTILIAHNIDLAPRIDALSKGDPIRFYGEYEWNEKGGVIHWTHDDPGGRHVGGWIEHEGKRFH